MSADQEDFEMFAARAQAHQEALDRLMTFIRRHAYTCGTAVPVRVALREYDEAVGKLEGSPFLKTEKG